MTIQKLKRDAYVSGAGLHDLADFCDVSPEVLESQLEQNEPMPVTVQQRLRKYLGWWLGPEGMPVPVKEG